MLALPLPAGLPKRRRYGRRFRKQMAELNTAAVATTVPGGLGSLSASFLNPPSVAGFADFSESAAAASVFSENLVKNRVEFCDFG